MRFSQGVLLVFSIFFNNKLCAQDLDPRAYAKIPINGTVLISGFSYSKGGVLTDPTLPLQNLEATVQVASVGVAKTFSLFGKTTQALAVLPFAWLNGSALINGQQQTGSRTGMADMRLRISVLLLGGKAVTLSEALKEAPSRTVLGTSLTVIAPTGEYFSDKLINLGTWRWSFKPELAITHKISKRWLIDFYTGVWLFTTNHSFYPGTSVRTQDPLVAFQTHLSYNINPRMWIAFNATFYTGGQSSVNDIHKDDRQSNSRIGATLALPIGKRNTLKLAYSDGAIIRSGADFRTVTIGWSSVWFKKTKASREQSE